MRDNEVLLFLGASHAAIQTAHLMQHLGSCLGIRSEQLAGFSTSSAAQGRDAIYHFAASTYIGVLVLLGKTYRSIDIPWPEGVEEMSVVLPRHGKATKVIRMPSAISSYWQSGDNIDRRIAQLREAVMGDAPATNQFMWPTAAWN